MGKPNPQRSLTEKDLVEFEVGLVLKVAHEIYGYDFTLYSTDSIVRRVLDFKDSLKLNSVAQIVPLLLSETNLLDVFLEKMSIGVTEFFRDPAFFKSYVENVIPYLASFPYIKIWHAGCSTGKEAYSNAILLHEAKLLERTLIYGTDFNNQSIRTAQEAIYTQDALSSAKKNYMACTNSEGFEKYYYAYYEHGKLENILQKATTFSYHNLVQDGIFGEMNVIFCRNVLIYFKSELQNRVLKLFSSSLRPGGFLCLGIHESLMFSEVKDEFEVVDSKNKIYRKKYCNFKET